MQQVDQRFLVDFNDRFIEFLARSESGYDVTLTDKVVIREIFKENVYQITEGDIDDTKVVIDLGGNIGAFSIYMAAMGAEKVIAYDPDSYNFEILTQNIQINNMQDVIFPIKKGVLDNPGQVEILNGQGATFVQGVKVLTDAAHQAVIDSNPTKETIEVVSLEQVYKENSVIYSDVLKVDIEGSEYKVFEGASPDTINKARYITMEFHPTTSDIFGNLISKLSLTHNIHIIGKYNVGGQIYAKRY